MKKKSFLPLLMFFSTPLLALNCEHLGITITNETDKTCVLKQVSPVYGMIYTGFIPHIITPGATAPPFFFQQGASGIGVELDYRCDNKIVIFYSEQSYCRFSAGKINGSIYRGNDLNASYYDISGGYWSGQPGQIYWRIFN